LAFALGSIYNIYGLESRALEEKVPYYRQILQEIKHNLQ